LAEHWIIWKSGIVNRLHEAGNEAIPQVVIGLHAGMQRHHAGLAIGTLAEERRTAEHFGPVLAQTLDMIGMTRMGERVLQDGIL